MRKRSRSKSPSRKNLKTSFSIPNPPIPQTQQIQTNQNSPFGKSSEILLLFMFLTAIGLLVFVYSQFPPLEKEEKEQFKLPQNLSQIPQSFQRNIKALASMLSKYSEKHYGLVVLTYCCTYVFLQTFSIPGSVFLSVIGGRLFGLFFGVLAVCCLTATGACFCYLLSYYIGRSLVQKLFPQKLALFGNEIQKHKHSILNYLLFLRMTPVVPSWFINIASPIFDVPLVPFALSTFLGIIPATILFVNGGRELSNVESPSDIVGWKTILFLFLFAFVALLPTWKPFQNFLNKLLGLENAKGLDVKVSKTKTNSKPLSKDF